MVCLIIFLLTLLDESSDTLGSVIRDCQLFKDFFLLISVAEQLHWGEEHQILHGFYSLVSDELNNILVRTRKSVVLDLASLLEFSLSCLIIFMNIFLSMNEGI